MLQSFILQPLKGYPQLQSRDGERLSAEPWEASLSGGEKMQGRERGEIISAVPGLQDLRAQARECRG